MSLLGKTTLVFALFLGAGWLVADAERARAVSDSETRTDHVEKGARLDKGKCLETTITKITTRFEDECILGELGEVTHKWGDHRPREHMWDCGLYVLYASGDKQASHYTEVTVKDGWRVGDPVRLCRVDTPRKCPSGNLDPVRVFRVTNLRTKTQWEEINRISGSCGPNDDSIARDWSFLLEIPKGLSKKEVFERLKRAQGVQIRRSDYCFPGWCDAGVSTIQPEDFEFIARADIWSLLIYGALPETFHSYTYTFKNGRLTSISHKPPTQ